MASFFDIQPNTSLLNLASQNQARAAEAGQGVADSITKVGSVFSKYANDKQKAEQLAVDNARKQDLLALQQNQDARAAENLILNQGQDSRAAAKHELELALKNPGSTQFKDLYKAKLAQYEKEQQLKAKYAKSGTPQYTNLYKKTGDGGVQTINVPRGDVGSYTNQGFSLGKYTAPKTSKGGTSNSKAKEDISKIIGSTGNSSDIVEAYNAYKGAGGSDKQFKNALLQVGGGDLDNKGYLDFGKKDLDVSSILEQVKAAQDTSNSGGRANVPFNADTKQQNLSTSNKFVEPKIGRTLVKGEIMSKIDGLRNPFFGSGIIDSAIKQQIDAEYGEGAYEKYNALTKK